MGGAGLTGTDDELSPWSGRSVEVDPAATPTPAIEIVPLPEVLGFLNVGTASVPKVRTYLTNDPNDPNYPGILGEYETSNSHWINKSERRQLTFSEQKLADEIGSDINRVRDEYNTAKNGSGTTQSNGLDEGVGDRYNEDTVVATDYAIGAFDGAGGHGKEADPAAAQKASRAAADAFERYFSSANAREFRTENGARREVVRALDKINKAVKRSGQGVTTGAGVVDVTINGERCSVAFNVGDGNVLAFNPGTGKIEKLFREENGEGAESHVLKNAFGSGAFKTDPNYRNPQVMVISNADMPGAVLFAVTDGLIDDKSGHTHSEEQLTRLFGKKLQELSEAGEGAQAMAQALSNGETSSGMAPMKNDDRGIAAAQIGKVENNKRSRLRKWFSFETALLGAIAAERHSKKVSVVAKAGQLALIGFGLYAASKGLGVFGGGGEGSIEVGVGQVDSSDSFDSSAHMPEEGTTRLTSPTSSVETSTSTTGDTTTTTEASSTTSTQSTTPSTPSTASSSTSTPTPSSTTTGVDVSGGGVDVFGGGVDASGSGSAESAAAGPSAGGETTGPGATDQGTGPSDADPAGATPEPEPTPELSENHTLEIAKGRGFEDAYEAELKASGAADGMTQQEVDDEAARIHQYMKLQHQATFDALKDAQLTYGEDLVSAPGELTVSEEFRNDLTEFTSGNKEVPTWEEIQEMRAEKAAEAADAATADADSGSGQSEQDGGGTTGPGVNDPGTGSTPEPEPEPEPTPEPAPELPAATPDNSLPNMDADTGRNSITGGFGALQGETDTQVLRDVYRYAEPTIAQIDAQYGPNSPFYFDEGEWRLNANAIDANGNIVITDTVLAKLNEAYGLIKNGNLSREEIDTLVAGQR